ncbi:MAG TPA: TlpA disulfide reductase family protein [bacterium]|nr:TlpA disulfide reductase family protein [bacterium]
MARCIRLAFALSLLVLGCSPSGKGPDLIPAAERLPAPEVKAHFLNASNGLSLSSMKGKVVVLDFWATWCGPCRMELPSLVRIYDDNHSKGLEMWGLSLEAADNKPDAYFQDFIAKNGLSYPIGLAFDQTIKDYGVSGIPATYFIDKKGRVALAFVGLHREEDLDGAVQELLAE